MDRGIKAMGNVEGKQYKKQILHSMVFLAIPTVIEQILSACALDALEKDELLKNVLGERLFGSYLAAKRAEWREYRTTVSEWEVSQYLNRF